MKVTEETDRPQGKGKILYYSIRTDAGSCIGSAFENINPLWDDTEITLQDAKKNATLWASAPDLLEALEKLYFAVYGGNSVSLNDAINRSVKTDEFEQSIISAIKKARGI